MTQRLILICCIVLCGMMGHAQQTYVLFGFDTLSYSEDDYLYQLYKIDIQSGASTLYLEFDKGRFDHPQMSGDRMYITSFCFDGTGENIYFLEIEGELFQYNIANDEMQFLLDVSPENMGYIWNTKNWTQDILPINDSLYQIGGGRKGIYNANQNTFQHTFDLATNSEAVSSEVCMNTCYRIAVYLHDSILIVNQSADLATFELTNSYNNSVIIDWDYAPELIWSAMIDYDPGCGERQIRVISDPNSNDDSITIYRIDFELQDLIFEHNIYSGYLHDVAPLYKFLDAVHFNEAAPYAGQDTSVHICQQNGAIILEDLVSETADSTGIFVDAQGTQIEEIDLNTIEQYEIYYISTRSYCSDTARVEIVINEPPMIEEVLDMNICYGEVSVVDLTVYDSIIWHDGSEELIRNIDEAGLYHYTVLHNSGCHVVDSFQVSISAAVEIEDEQYNICPGDTIEIGDEQYISEGVYSDTLLNNLLCDSLIINRSIIHYIEQALEIEYDASVCWQDSSWVDIVSAHGSIEINNEPSSSHFLLGPGVYSISAVDDNGCMAEDEIEIISYDYPEVNTDPWIEIVQGVEVSIPVEYIGEIETYHWEPSEGLDCSNCPYPILENYQNTQYEIIVINEHGCTDTAMIEIRIAKDQIYIPNIIKGSVSVGENGTFYLQGKMSHNYELYIYDRWGNEIFRRMDAKMNAMEDGWTPREDYNAGVFHYMAKLEGNNKIISGSITLVR